MADAKSILITGVGGLLGYHLAKECLRRGILVNGLGRNRNHLIEELEKQNSFKFFSASIENASEITPVFKEKVDIVYHLAGQPSVYFANSNPVTDFNVNVIGTLNVLEHIRRGGADKIVYPSTGDVYQDTYMANEMAATRPSNFYGLSKLTAETYIRQYGDMFGIRYTIFRMSILYGPHFRRNAMFDIMNSLLNGKKVKLFTSLQSELDFLFVEDAVKAMLAAATKEWDGTTVNISSGEGIKVSLLIKMIAKKVGIPEPETEVAENNLAKKVYPNKRARELGWYPEHSLSEGIEKTIAWLRESKNEDT